jgi:hypothetical protein
VVSAPDYTRTCSCAYQNQTSLALIHMPDIDLWTRNDFAFRGGKIRRVGVNFGAAGDRRESTGTLWIEYPPTSAPSPKLPLKLSGKPEYFQVHASRVSGDVPGWVAASGMHGETEITLALGTRPSSLADGLRIASGEDDAEEIYDGTVRLDSSDIELTEDRSQQVVGLRFNEIEIPPGARIEEAYLQFKSGEPAKDPAPLVICAEAADDAAPFKADKRNLSSRKRVPAAVTWDPEPWEKKDEAGDKQRSPDLAPVLRQVVRRQGWKSGNAIAILIYGKGRRVTPSYDGDPEGAPALVVKLDPTSFAKKPKPESTSPPKYTVRLHFAEPTTAPPGKRVFDVSLQGREVLKNLDIVQIAGGPNRSFTREFRNVEIEGDLKIALKSAPGDKKDRLPPILCGLEVIAEDLTSTAQK